MFVIIKNCYKKWLSNKHLWHQ